VAERSKMTVSDRAKQFKPFAAVTGLDHALRLKEREMARTERTELSEEAAAELDRRIRDLKAGDDITARYYCGGEYLTVIGKVSKLKDGMLYVGEISIPVSALTEIN